MEFIFLVAAISLVTLLAKFIENHRKAAEDRRRLLEEAIRSGADRQVIEALTWHATGARPQQPRAAGGAAMAVLLAIGWITLFVGVGVGVLGGMSGWDDTIGAGVLVSIIGFGLVTYPFALRELEARRAAQ
jgi:hypothetical protein